MICSVAHPKYGFGKVLELSYDIEGNLLAFVRWAGSHRTGIAGGWYDLANEHFTIEGAVQLAQAVRELENNGYG